MKPKVYNMQTEIFYKLTISRLGYNKKGEQPYWILKQADIQILLRKHPSLYIPFFMQNGNLIRSIKIK